MNKYSVYCLTNDVFLFLGEGCVIGDFHIYPRIILISDGRPTDFTETNTSDDCPQNETENVILILSPSFCPSTQNLLYVINNPFTVNYICFTKDKNQLLQLTANIGRRYPIFCIPVGRNPDMVLHFYWYKRVFHFVPW